jgi:hypothetical protein
MRFCTIPEIVEAPALYTIQQYLIGYFGREITCIFVYRRSGTSKEK